MARRREKSPAESKKKRRARKVKVRRLDDDFEELRFEPKPSSMQIVSVVLMSLGGIALGIGFYASFLRDESLPAIGWAPFVSVLGLAFLIAYFVIGRSAPPVVRVGPFGIAREQGERLDRTSWYQIREIDMSAGALRVRPAGAALLFEPGVHGPAIARIVAEAQKRVPDRVEIDDDTLATLGRPGDEGELVEAEPPQVTSLRCAASDQPFKFERDVRMCDRCAALYHRGSVPKECVECGARLAKS